MIKTQLQITDLPKEILEKIFIKLPYWQIPELTEICKQFNDVVSSSVQLMESFDVQWRKREKGEDIRMLLSSTRKYRRMQILEAVGLKKSLRSFLDNHSSTLTFVSMHDCSLKSSELRTLLDFVAPNIKTFSMCDVNFEVDCEVVPLKLPKLDYMEVMYGAGEGYCSIINFFAEAPNIKVIQSFTSDHQIKGYKN